MANLTNSGKLIDKLTSIDSAIEGLEDKLGTVPAGTDIMSEIDSINDKIGELPSGKTAAQAISDAQTAADDAAQDAADVASDLASYKTTVADTYATKDSVASAFLYKGTKQSYSDLPASGNKVGDVWNIETADASHGVSAGDNVVWNGTAWDVLSGVMDLSNFFNKSTDTSDAITEGSTHLFMTSAERSKLANQSGTNTGDETQATIKSKLGAASASADGYLTKEDFAEFDGKQDAIADLETIRSGAAAGATALQAGDASYVSNTVAEGADDKLTVTAADNVTLATAESNNKSAIANIASAHNDLVDRVVAVESATGSLPFTATFADVTLNGTSTVLNNAAITDHSHISFVVKSGDLNGYTLEKYVEAGKCTFVSNTAETATLEVLILNKNS